MSQDDKSFVASPQLVAAAVAPTWLAVSAGCSLLVVVAIGVLGITQSLAVYPSQLPVVADPLADKTTPATPPHCQVATVAKTGRFDAANVRIRPASEPPSGWLPKGARVEVCDVTETAGVTIPNRWRRISGGTHDGKWVHEDVLEFR